MKRLIIIRHGNTFRPGETPLRVGCRTDLPLVEEERALAAGRFLARQAILPDRVVAAPLLRTVQTAQLVLRALDIERTIEETDVFSEIDYGPDEGRDEDAVMDRLGRFYLDAEGRLAGADAETIRHRGKETIELWNREAVPPAGWSVDPEAIVRGWIDFASEIVERETVLVVSSNGIIRFAPRLLPAEDYRRFTTENDLKVTTGGTCIFRYENDRWHIDAWNVKPEGS